MPEFSVGQQCTTHIASKHLSQKGTVRVSISHLMHEPGKSLVPVLAEPGSSKHPRFCISRKLGTHCFTRTPNPPAFPRSAQRCGKHRDPHTIVLTQPQFSLLRLGPKSLQCQSRPRWRQPA